MKRNIFFKDPIGTFLASLVTFREQVENVTANRFQYNNYRYQINPKGYNTDSEPLGQMENGLIISDRLFNTG